jgi:protein gp37
MAKLINNIGWCDVTGNKVIGCDKVSDGCKNCYAQNDTPARVLRIAGSKHGAQTETRVVIEGFAKKVRRLNRFCICDKCKELIPIKSQQTISGVHAVCGGFLRRIRIFADSNSDWLDLKWKIETFADLLRDIYECPNLDFLLLTKRPENFEGRLAEAVKALLKTATIEDNELLRLWIDHWRKGMDIPRYVWIGASVENQKAADERIPKLIKIPAPIWFLSCEPLLGRIDFRQVPEFNKAGGAGREMANKLWVICGGESGNGFREMEMASAELIHDQCALAGVPFYMKQDSSRKNGERARIPDRIWKQQFPVLT